MSNHRSKAKGAKRQKRAAEAKRKRADAPKWSPSRDLFDDAYWEQGPDPDQPNTYNLIQARLPSGGRQQPPLIYRGRDVTARLQKFCTSVLEGMGRGSIARQERLVGEATHDARIELAAVRLYDLLQHAGDVQEFARHALVAAGTAWMQGRGKDALPEFLEALRHQIDHSPALRDAPPTRH